MVRGQAGLHKFTLTPDLKAMYERKLSCLDDLRRSSGRSHEVFADNEIVRRKTFFENILADTYSRSFTFISSVTICRRHYKFCLATRSAGPFWKCPASESRTTRVSFTSTTTRVCHRLPLHLPRTKATSDTRRRIRARLRSQKIPAKVDVWSLTPNKSWRWSWIRIQCRWVALRSQTVICHCYSRNCNINDWFFEFRNNIYLLTYELLKALDTAVKRYDFCYFT